MNTNENQVVIENYTSRMEISLILKNFLQSVRQEENGILNLTNEYYTEISKNNQKITFFFKKAVSYISL